MCDVVTPTMLLTASLGASAASAGVGYIAQSQAASAQAEYQSELYSATGRAASENYLRSISLTGERIDQSRESFSQQATANAIEAIRARAGAAASAGEAGIGGNTLKALLADFDQQEAANRYVLQQNFGWQQRQLTEELRGVRADAQNRITAALPAPVAQPSLLAAGLNVLGQGLNTYDNYSYRSGTGAYAPRRTTV